MASVDRTAYPRLPSMISVRELAEAFTPTVAEVKWARTSVIGPQALVALLVMLKCYQRLGYFPQWERVGPEVVEHVRARAVEVTGVGIDPPGRVSDRVFRRGRELVRQHTGAVRDPDRVHAVAETAMRQVLQGKDNPADVINVALEELTGQGCELRPIRCWIVWPDRCGPRSTAGSTGWWLAGWMPPRGAPWPSCWWWTGKPGKARYRR